MNVAVKNYNSSSRNHSPTGCISHSATPIVAVKSFYFGSGSSRHSNYWYFEQLNCYGGTHIINSNIPLCTVESYNFRTARTMCSINVLPLPLLVSHHRITGWTYHIALSTCPSCPGRPDYVVIPPLPFYNLRDQDILRGFDCYNGRSAVIYIPCRDVALSWIIARIQLSTQL